MPSWRSYLKMWICRGPTLSWRPSSRPSGVWWRPKPASRPSHSCQSTSLHPNTQLVYSAVIPLLHLRGGPCHVTRRLNLDVFRKIFSPSVAYSSTQKHIVCVWLLAIERVTCADIRLYHTFLVTVIIRILSKCLTLTFVKC